MSVVTKPQDQQYEELNLDEGGGPLFPPEPPADKERAWHEWAGIAIGLFGLLSVMALILSLVALSSSNSNTVKTVAVATPAAAAPSTAAAPVAKPVFIGMSIKADDEHGKLGPDGKWHDAFLPANITVHAGDKVTITFTNYDGGPHTFTSPSLGVNQVINSGSMNAPQVVKLTFTAPKKAGHYVWWCSAPCDPWAMKRIGYMRGIVTVKA